MSKIEYDKQHSSHKQDYDFKNEESFDFSSANKITRNAHNDVTLTPLLNNSSSNIIDIEVQSESSKVEEMKTKIRLEKPTKYGRFLSAPITKFTIHVTAYLVFLALFTYYYLYKITRDHYNAFQIAQLSFLGENVVFYSLFLSQFIFATASKLSRNHKEQSRSII